MKLSREMGFLICATAIALGQEPQTRPKADVVFLHGNIYTGIAPSASFHEIKRADAMAIRGDRIQAIGKEEEILKWKGPQTEVVNLGGHFVMPGFNDAHMHLAAAGLQRLEVNLVGVKSLTEFRDRIRARVETAEPGEWIVGGGWDHTLWPVKELPSRWDIDEVTTNHPVFLQRIDGHIAVANTRALQLASITIASHDPPGGQIDHDSTGQPTGILREIARQAVAAMIPTPNHDKRRQALEVGFQDLAQWGVTSIQDYSNAEDSQICWEEFQIIEEIEREAS
jgi:predicted amidohydrolase YtcJ